jgi:hypothetical protein
VLAAYRSQVETASTSQVNVSFVRHKNVTIAPPLRIALESFLIAGRQMIRAQSTRKTQMKTILMLIVGLMLAGCGSMENHVRNHGVASTSRLALQDRGETIAVDTICACP